jgi:hypothetical protein
MRDEHGRAQVAAPEADNDIIRKGDVTGLLAALEAHINEGIGESLAGAVAGAVATPFGWGHVTDGRNLLEVLGAGTVADAVEALHRKINADGVPDFSGLQIGDYLDLPSLDDGTTVYTWNEAYKNLHVVISGFNTYKGMGSTENAKNHIVFTFENCPLTKRMNATGDNTGGYPASELKTYLEGGFLTGLAEALGHDYLYAVQRYISTKGSTAWLTAKIFLLTEIEVFGLQCFGDELNAGTSLRNHTPIQLPIYRDSYKHRIKRYNGSRQLWWLSTPYSGGSASLSPVMVMPTTTGRVVPEALPPIPC